MTAVHLAHDGTGFRVYRTETGRDRAYVGPSWASPREAIRYADALEVVVSPLRASTEDPTTNTGSLPVSVGELGSSVDVPIGRVPAARTDRR
jgi:hypothetical protein